MMTLAINTNGRHDAERAPMPRHHYRHLRWAPGAICASRQRLARTRLTASALDAVNTTGIDAPMMLADFSHFLAPTTHAWPGDFIYTALAQNVVMKRMAAADEMGRNTASQSSKT